MKQDIGIEMSEFRHMTTYHSVEMYTLRADDS